MKRSALHRYLRFWHPDVEDDVDEELRFHMEMRERDYVASGLGPNEAHAEAVRRFGKFESVREICYEIGHQRERSTRIADFMQGVRNDVVFALRQLARNPGFTIAAVVTLALGIGANSLVFDVVNAVLLRPLPGIATPGRVITVNHVSVSYPSYRDFRDASAVVTSVAAFNDQSTAVSDGKRAEMASVGVVSGNYFGVLGVTPLRGRLLVPSDDDPGSRPVAVLSAGFAQHFFPGDESIVGRTIYLNGAPVTIVGLASKDFHGTQLDSRDDMWISIHSWMGLAPTPYSSLNVDMRGWSWLRLIGRLRPGATIEQATSALKLSAVRQEAAYPDAVGQLSGRVTNTSVTLVEQSAISSISHETTVRSAVIVAAVVAIVLLIACANVSNLLIARAMSRRREMGVRIAIGARRGRLVRQLLTEAAVLAIIAAVVGLLLTQLGLQALTHVSVTDGFSFATLGVQLGGRVAVYTLAVALVASVLFSVVPTLHSTRAEMTGALKDGVPGGGRSQPRLHRALLMAQVSLSLVLVIAAGLFVRSLQHALATDPGFDGSHVATASISVGLIRSDSARAGLIYGSVTRQLVRAPGVQVAAWGTSLPLDRLADVDGFALDDYVPGPNERLMVQVSDVSPGYFEAFSIPLIKGRLFDERDGPSTPNVAIINQTMARQYWRNGTPIGKRILFGDDTVTVVGVVRDIKYHELREDPVPFVYRVLGQHFNTSGLAPQNLVVRSSGPPAAMLGLIRRTLHHVAPEVPVYDVVTFDERTGHTVFAQRLGTVVLGLFSVIALIITAVGIYGVVAYGVKQRTHEIGIRVALGARTRSVLSVILIENLTLIAAGVAAGLALSAVLMRTVSSFLFGIGDMDAATFCAASALLLGVGITAALIPALRATRVDPVIALRSE